MCNHGRFFGEQGTAEKKRDDGMYHNPDAKRPSARTIANYTTSAAVVAPKTLTTKAVTKIEVRQTAEKSI